ncbi:MAG: ROK family protein [Clostridia bacterium]
MKKMIGQPQYIKEVNIDIVEDIIAERGPISKPEISKISSLSLPTVNKIVDALQESNRIKASGVSSSGIGRKAQFYVVNENSGCILVLYFINDSYICSVVNAIGELTYKCTIPVDTSSKSSALKSTYKAIDKLMSHTESGVKAIGIGVPGVVKSNNILSNIPSIPEWEGINLKEVIEAKYSIVTFVENDVKLTTMGFYHNVLKHQYDNMIYIYLGKGIGSGIIINKTLYKGFKSFAGELGYMIVEEPSEVDTAYIRRGLLEQKMSTLIQILQGSSNPEESNMAEREQLIKLLSFSITNLICTLNPEVIVLSGDIVSKQLISDLKMQVRSFVDDESMPVFMSNDSKASGISGIVNMCVSNISSKFQLVKGKGV